MPRAKRAAYKVAITGHRPNRLPRRQWPRLMRQLGEVMAGLEAENPRRRFVLLSGLAEGADRLAAKAALARGWGLVAMLPFSRMRTLEDFPRKAARIEFAALIVLAERVDDAPAADVYADEAQPYAELGDRLADEADALIAIWDGEAPQGRGGTVDVMRAAQARPIPVIRLHALEDRPPEFLPGLPAQSRSRRQRA